ncbi:MAG TPA: sigma-70 family RNA polymerase sigma factor [Blastocatellia bacterium]|nr:sigma-70 family RNA polymerase sigma factor [Blastocatellia bacterium]
MTDERLLAEAGCGDEAAFRTLYERHRDAVFRFAFRLCHSAEIAEDITQDCFLGLVVRPQGFDPSRARLRTYLYGAVRNQALKHFHRQGNEVVMENPVEESEPAGGREALSRLLDSELSDAVQRAIAALPLAQREAMILFEYEELSLAEIAEIVGTEIGTVKSRLHRGRENLRRLLAPYLKNGSPVAGQLQKCQ